MHLLFIQYFPLLGDFFLLQFNLWNFVHKFCIKNNLKSFQKALIGWKKAGLPKKPILFWLCKQAIYDQPTVLQISFW